MLDDLVFYFPYLGIFLLLILGGIGLPFPEDLTLVLAGQVAFTEQLNLPILLGVCFVGVISMDLVLFYLGRRYGRAIMRFRYIRRIFTPKRRVQVRQQFYKMGDFVVFIARFIGGFRTPVFMTAGMLKMSYKRFLFLDITASLLSIPLFVMGSYFLGQKFEEAAHGVTSKITIGIVVLMTLFSLGVLIHWYRDSRKQAKKLSY
jgi:membrane protein DedA with SNARE-associated domain